MTEHFKLKDLTYYISVLRTPHFVAVKKFDFLMFQLLESNDWEDVQTLELPDADRDNVSLLLEVVYNGVVEATIEDLRRLILLAHSLYITIPLSDELMDTLELTLPKITPFVPRGIPRIKLRPNYQPIPAMPKQNQPMKAIPPKLPMLKLKLPLPQGMAEKKKSSESVLN